MIEKSLIVFIAALLLTACSLPAQSTNPVNSSGGNATSAVTIVSPTAAATVFASSATPNYARKFAPLSPGDYTRQVPGWDNRPYSLHIPANYNPANSYPVVLAIHGGGGSSDAMAKLTCPAGDPNDPNCLNKMADRRGLVIVYPNGTPNPNPRLAKLRTWNAGGGDKGFSCVSGVACKNKVDDIGYFKALLADLENTVNVDQNRVYATGISNGAAMCQRLACELSDKIAAIAPVSGGNQFSTVANCNPSRPVPVLEIHGTADPGWPYDGGENAKSLWNYIGATPGKFISIPQTVADWVKRNGCNYSEAKDEALPVIVNDDTTVTKTSYPACKNGADVVFYKIENGGHTWPEGWQYFPVSMVGITSRNLNANEVILDFFQDHPKQ